MLRRIIFLAWEDGVTVGATARRQDRLCSLVSKANGEDPIGTAKAVDTRLVVEIAQPWQRDVLGSRRSVEGLRPVVEGAQERGLLGGFSAILPDREYSRRNHTRFLFLRRPPDRSPPTRRRTSSYPTVSS